MDGKTDHKIKGLDALMLQKKSKHTAYVFPFPTSYLPGFKQALQALVFPMGSMGNAVDFPT